MRFEKVLGTPDVLLRQLEISDVTDKYINWLHSPKINKFMQVRINPPNLEEQKVYVQNCIESEDEILFGIFENNFVMIGTLKVTFIDPLNIEIGIMIGEKERHGVGVGKNSLNLIIEWAREINLDFIHAGYEIHNNASKNLFKSLGFDVHKGVINDLLPNESPIIERVWLSLQ
jgi:RimJ/RimL family protein N-acetyltransferase